MNKRDLNYFRIASKVAMSSTYRGHNRYCRTGCIIVSHGKIISKGFNQDKTDPLQMRYNKYRMFTDFDTTHKLHAEIAALKHTNANLRSASIYVSRILENGEYAMSRPCDGCMACIRDRGIKHVYYTTNDGFAYEYLES